MRSNFPILALALLFFAVFPDARLSAQCGCTNCPQPVPDGFSGSFNISVSGSTNNVLGQNGQAVCGVTLSFTTSYIGDLAFALVSPGNDTIELTGPQGFFNSTSNSIWNIGFVPCAEAAVPDAGFLPVFSNAQDWGLFGQYTGSYYPFDGCLEDFSGGPVNGEWKLVVTDGQDFDAGILYDWSIEFCDPSGINCFSCAANAGTLPQPDVLACLNDTSLNLSLPPTYPTGQSAAPSPVYTYSYIVAGAGGVIQAYLPKPDLRNYPTGTYTICGVSYLTADQAKLPAPGSTTVQSLSQQLAGGTPPFCGKITPNCVNVTISQPVPDESETATICAPDSFQFHGQWFKETGIYTLDLASGGCEYTATLDLKVGKTTNDTIREYICGTGCSAVPGFATACATGVYQNSGQTAEGCDSTVTLILSYNQVTAAIAPPPVLPCGGNPVIVSGAGSTTGTDIAYNWWAAPGGNITGTTNTIDTEVGLPGDYFLAVCRPNADGSTCCDTATVTVQQNAAAPAAPASIIGDDEICLGRSLILSILPVPNATGYTWTTPTDVSITANTGTSVTLLWNSVAGGPICVNSFNACGQSQSTCLTINLLDVPVLGSVSGLAAVCKGAVETYSVPSLGTGTTYDWTVPPLATITAGQGTSLIQVSWGQSNSGLVCCTARNDCGASVQSCQFVTLASGLAAPAISGDATVCAGGRGIYTMQPMLGTIGYQWSVPPGATIFSGQNTPQIVVDWGTATSGDVCLRAVGPCGNSPQTCFPVVVAPAPTANAGPSGAVCGQVFNLNAQLSAVGNSGIWSQTAGPGTTVFANPTAAATAATADQFGQYTFQWIENQGLCADTATLSVVFNEPPSTGPATSTCDNIRENYFVQFAIQGGLGPYTVPGGTVLNGQFISQFLPSGSPYSFMVTDANGCTANVVAGSHTCNCVTSAGIMQSTLLTVCEGQTATVAAPTNRRLDANDVGTFVLHDQPGASLGQIFNVNSTGTFGFGPGLAFDQTYFISFVAGNDSSGFPKILGPCFSVAPGQPVVFRQQPTPDAGPDADTCGLQILLNATPSVGAGQWSLVQNPPGGAVVFGNTQSPNSSATATQSGIYELQWTETNLGCTASDRVTVSFFDRLTTGQLHIGCDALDANFTVTIPVVGGTAPYSANGQPFVGNSFISNAIANGGVFNFQISDANGCTATPVVGTHNCNCTTSAGTMPTQLLTVCGPDSVTVQTPPGVFWDANDVGAFVLHDQPGTALGTVFAQNTTGKFGHAPGLVFGQTYYVSYINGDNLNGLPDPLAACFSVSPGQPVRFFPKPAADAGKDSTTCGLALNLNANNSQSGTWTVATQPPGGSLIFSNSQNPAATANASLAGWYDLVWTVSENGCTASDTVRTGFFFKPEADTLTFVCDDVSENFTVSFPIVGGLLPYFVDGQAVAGSTFTSGQLPTGASFSFQITDASNCPSDPVAGSHQCECTTSAGTMSSQPVEICGLQNPAIGQHIGDMVLDANDLGTFILHDGTAGTVGQILATSAGGQFNFMPGMMAGRVYFIVFAAGNDAGGLPNPNDRCYSISSGQPVVWQTEVAASVTPTAEICNAPTGGSVLNFNDLIVGGDATGTWQNLSGAGAGSFPVLDFDGVQPGVYDFEYTTAAAVLPCQNQTYPVKITVRDCACPPLEILPAPNLCNAGGTLDLATLQQNTAAGAWQITQTPPGTNPATLTGTIFDANGSDAGSYEITFALINVPPTGCPASFSEILEVKKSVTAGTASQPAEICAGEPQIFNLKNMLTGAGAGGTWSETSAKPSTGGAFDALGATFAAADQVAGTYTYIYVVSAEAPCVSDTATVQIEIHPRPVADAGSDQEISCLRPTVTLGGPNTSTWPGVAFAWNFNGSPLSGATASRVETVQVGDFQLIVRDTTTGCSATDEVLVSGAIDIPAPKSIETGQLRCYGDTDGFIKIGEVVGGLPPYQFSLNGGALSSGQFFGNLGAGNYVLEIEDAAGCSWQSGNIEIVEPQEVVVELGSDILSNLGDSVLLSGEISVGQAAIDTLIWSPLRNPEYAGSAHQKILSVHSQVFELTVIDTAGCRAHDAVLVLVDPTRRVFVPNVFAPGSTANGLLTVFGGTDVAEVESFEIFDRWGEQVFGAYDFQPSDPTHAWDGNFGGKQASLGVYVFRAKIKFRDGKTEFFTGDVVLKR